MDASWYQRMVGKREDVQHLSYIDGVEDFQKRAIKVLEKEIKQDEGKYLPGVAKALELIKTLKAK